MQFGIREICDVVLRAKSYQTLGNKKFYKDEPVLYFDSLKTSSLEGAATTVYATGGHGNARLVAWEGERTLTFTMEDALLSMESFSVLSGAGLIDATGNEPIYVHQTSQVEVKENNTIVLPDDKVCWSNEGRIDDDEFFKKGADIFVMVLDDRGEVAEEPCIPVEIIGRGNGETTIICYSHNGVLTKDTIVLVDYYVKRTSGAQMIEITSDKFGGNYYLEASTLFRSRGGVDMPAEFIIPNCKIQSNFTFSLAATGDPSTFTFTMDAFPDYTKFDKTHKVMAAIQVISDESGLAEGSRDGCAEGEPQVSTKNSKIRAILSGNTVYVRKDSDYTCEGVSGVDYDTNLFNEGGIVTGLKGAQVNIMMPISGAGTYKVVQINPGLEYYDDIDEHVNPTGDGKSYKKECPYTIGANEDFEYSLLVTDKPGAITVELLDEDNESIKKFSVINEVF